MKNMRYSNPTKTGLQVFLLLAILVLNVGPLGSGTVYAAAPANDNLIDAMAVSLGNSYTINDVEEATIQAGEIAPTQNCDGYPLELGWNSVWFSYEPISTGYVSFDTVGSLLDGGELDTYITVWTGDKTDINTLTMIGCDDNNEVGFTSQIGFNAESGTTYYIQVAKYQCRIDLGCDEFSAEPACGDDYLLSAVCSVKLTVKNQTFADVGSTHPYFEEIEALYAAGLTAGCQVTPVLKFCPGTKMDRAQSAVFMLRGQFGSSYTPVTPTGFFKDNWAAAAWAQGWAESMFIEELTAGCKVNPRMFCPYTILTNEMAAVFALRLKYGMTYFPPAATGTVFADMTDTSHWSISWVEQAYADGLIIKCGDDFGSGKPLICPTKEVDRGYGAFIISKAKNLVP